MLTIRVISDEDGSEFVKSEVRTVCFNPPTEAGRAASLFVWYKDDVEAAETFLSGRIFLMNENGKTVANYHLYALPGIPRDVREDAENIEVTVEN